MGAEVGATTSTFPYTPNMRKYLTATGRGPVAWAADEAASDGFLSADEGAQYDEVIEIVSIIIGCRSQKPTFLCQNLSELEPTINGPFTPDLATPLSKFASFVKEQGWKDELSAGLIGSCTNSSYEDMVRDVYLSCCPFPDPTFADKRREPCEASQRLRPHYQGF